MLSSPNSYSCVQNELPRYHLHQAGPKHPTELPLASWKSPLISFPSSDYTLPHFSDQALSTLTVPGHITVMGTWGVSSTATLDFSCFSLEVITTRSDLSLQSLVASPSFCLNSKISLKFLTYLCRLLSLLITSFSWAESTFSWLTGPAQHLKQNRCRINKWMKEVWRERLPLIKHLTDLKSASGDSH